MHIHFSQSDDTACAFYRMGAPARSLSFLKGYTTACTFLNHPMLWKHIEDICVIQRQYTPKAFQAIQEKRQYGIPVVGELDDDVFHIPPGRDAYEAYSHGNTLKQEAKYREMGKLGKSEHLLSPRVWLANFLRCCDGITVPVPALAAQLRKYNKNVYVLPNYLDDRVIPKWPKPEPPGKTIRILWTGSKSHVSDVTPMFKALARIMAEDKRVVYVHIGAYFKESIGMLPQDRVEVYPSTPNQRRGHFVPIYYKFLTGLPAQIGLAPLESTTFNLSKSSIKALEYGMAGYYPILQDYAPYSHFKNTDAGPLIGWVTSWSESAWYNAIHEALSDMSATTKAAASYQQWVYDNCRISKNIHEWVEVYERILSGPRNTWFPNVIPEFKRM